MKRVRGVVAAAAPAHASASSAISTRPAAVAYRPKNARGARRARRIPCRPDRVAHRAEPDTEAAAAAARRARRVAHALVRVGRRAAARGAAEVVGRQAERLGLRVGELKSVAERGRVRPVTPRSLRPARARPPPARSSSARALAARGAPRLPLEPRERLLDRLLAQLRRPTCAAAWRPACARAAARSYPSRRAAASRRRVAPLGPTRRHVRPLLLGRDGRRRLVAASPQRRNLLGERLDIPLAVP